MLDWCLRRREVNRGGLPMLYEILLEIAGPELKCALEVTQSSSDKVTTNVLSRAV